MIETYHLSKVYSRGVYALRDVTLSIDKGEFLFLTGASGAGKSTLLRLLLCAEKPTEGTLKVGGRVLSDLTPAEVQGHRRSVGFVFQDFRLVPRFTVFQNVAFVMRVLGVDLATQQRKTFQVLKWVGLQHRMNAYPEELSGGEQQRVAVARALVNDPQILLADEPTGNLDPDLSLEIMNLFREANSRGTTVLVATHDLWMIRRVGRRVVGLEHGRVVEVPDVRLLRYAFDEAAGSLWRGRRSSLLSTATIAIALFVTGAFLIVTSNLERMAEEWSGAAEMSVYLTEAFGGPERAALERELRADPSVTGVEFISKEAALTRFRATFPDLAQTLGGLAENPLPASLDVRLRSTSGASDPIDALVTRMRATPGVADVRYDKDWLDRLLRGVRLLRAVGFALGGALLLAAALTITNVVRLALNARRDELDIMQLVGAPPAYVRGPFVMEGALHGGMGALVALLVLAAVFFSARARVLTPLASALNLSSVSFLSPLLVVLMVGGGLGVGCLAGWVASRRA